MAIVLSAHFPFSANDDELAGIRLSEVVFNSYLPLLMTLQTVGSDSGTVPVGISVSPTLLEMISRDGFTEKLRRYADETAYHIARDMRFFAEGGRREYVRAAEYWLQRIERLVEFFDRIEGDIIRALKDLAGHGLELLAAPATNSCLQLIGNTRSARMQILTGVSAFEEHLGFTPEGMLVHCIDSLPAKDTDDIIDEAGLKYILSADSVAGCCDIVSGRAGDRRLTGKAASGQPGWLPLPAKVSSHVMRLEEGRHPDVVRKSACLPANLIGRIETYPLNTCYLDTAKRNFPGHGRYWRRGGSIDGTRAGAYDPSEAESMVISQATDFLETLRTGCRKGAEFAPLVIGAGLLGNIWHEGPQWFESVLAGAAENRIELIGPRRFAMDAPAECADRDDASTSGEECMALLSSRQAERMMKKVRSSQELYWNFLVRYLAGEAKDDIRARAAEQAGRELLLLESIDWPVMASLEGESDYAGRRVDSHHRRFIEMAKISAGKVKGTASLRLVEECETSVPVFNVRDGMVHFQQR